MRGVDVLISTVGTDGDALPFFYLARELVNLGLNVTVLSNTNHEWRAKEAHAHFMPISPPDWPQVGRDDSAFFREIIAPSYINAHIAMQEKAENGRRLLLINRTGNWGALFSAERLCIPVMRVALQPCSILKDGHPVDPSDLKLVNDYRVRIGLAALDDSPTIVERAIRTFSLFPAWFGRPQSDSLQAGQCVGFPFNPTESSKAQHDLAKRIERHGRPIIFTPGTGVQDTKQMFNAALAASDAGQSVIFLSRHLELGNIQVPPCLGLFDYIDHAIALPTAKAVVHNGGIGTLSQCIRAGVPQIINPLVYDQPDNASRMKQLSLGFTLSEDELSYGNIADCLEAFDSDPLLTSRLRAFSDLVVKDRAISVVAGSILRWLAD